MGAHPPFGSPIVTQTTTPGPPESNRTMDERAKIPVSLPRDNPTQSYWQDPPDDIADLRTTPHLPGSADVVIVGSGITGAAVAWNLLQDGNGTSSDSPGTVVMLEARQACSGATGRNGQLTSPAPPFLRDAAGPRRAPRADRRTRSLAGPQAATRRRPATAPSSQTSAPWAPTPPRGSRGSSSQT